MPSAPPLGTVDIGDLFIGADKEMWLGVPTAQDPAGAILVSDIAGLTATIAATSTNDRSYTDGQIVTRAPTVHTHAISDVVGLPAALTVSTTGFQSGMMILWSGTLLTIPAGWVLCDGTNGTPDMRDRFPLGAGGAAAQMSVGGAAPGAGATGLGGAHAHGGVTSPHSLTGAELAPHVHALFDTGHTHAVTGGTDNQNAHQHFAGYGTLSGFGRYSEIDVGAPGALTAVSGFTNIAALTSIAPAHSHNVGGTAAMNTTGITMGNIGSGDGHSHPIPSEADHTHPLTTTLPPYRVLAFIMKL